VPVVLEAKVEGFLGRQGDVDVLAERHPGCRLAEATVCGKGRDTIQYTGGTLKIKPRSARMCSQVR
jgi:hypothetical protein